MIFPALITNPFPSSLCSFHTLFLYDDPCILYEAENSACVEGDNFEIDASGSGQKMLLHDGHCGGTRSRVLFILQ